MKIGSPVPHHKARIEIIPLIDIMFFLLASFMMASLSMIKLQSIKLDLPAAVMAKRDFNPDIVNISVDKTGDMFIEKTQMNLAQVSGYLSNKFRSNTNLPVYISGDKDATHGSIIRVLDLIRRVGIQRVSFTIAPAQPRQPSQ
jgi:biopolymer transport protein ExbD